MGNAAKIKCAFITTDAREQHGELNEPDPSIGPAPRSLLDGFADCPGVEVHVIFCMRRPIRSLEKMADNVFFHGVVVPQIGWLRTGYQGCVRAVRKKLKEIQPDIVHGQGTERDCAISAVLSGRPNVITIHGNMRLIAQLNRARPFSYEWLAARLEGFTVPRSDGVVCITNYTRNAVAGLARKTWVVPNAVNAGFFEVRTEIHPEHPPTILCVGAICPRKNQNAFIRALDPLAAQRKFKAVFFGKPGGDDYGAEFLQLVRERHWCEHVGFAVGERLKSRFKTAALLALPSLEDNCPMVVLEAMAAGVPVVAAKVGGVPDLIEDGKTGLLCDPLDAASIRSTVTKLLDSPELGRQLATEAKQHALKCFRPVAVAQRHLEIYREVLRQRMV